MRKQLAKCESANCWAEKPCSASPKFEAIPRAHLALPALCVRQESNMKVIQCTGHADINTTMNIWALRPQKSQAGKEIDKFV